MKFVSTQLSYFLADPTVKRNTRALLKYIGFVVMVVVMFAILFHLIMIWQEGERYSWVTGFYWTLTVMSTLGFGDITFTTDIGRAFSMLVLVSGIVLLLIVLPFAFIRFFYAPWLEAQIHMRAPRFIPEDTEGHVLICNYETIAESLIDRLRDEDVQCFVLVPDSSQASELRNRNVPVVTGDFDSPITYENLRADKARMIVANRDDTVNTNIILTVREVSPAVQIAAIASSDDAVDVLRLSGATDVLPVKRWLGEHLANRVSATRAHSHIVGSYEGLQVAELPVRRTPLVGKTIRDTRLREVTGLNIIAVWERGHLHPARADLQLTNFSVPVIIGTQEQFDQLDDLLLIYDYNPNPVLIIGAGRVGRSAARALKEKEVPVHIVERNPAMVEKARALEVPVFLGDAEDFGVLFEAGIQAAPSVVLTTHDDPMNIYLSSYCRRLNENLRIVSRVTHERNVESIYRAGADFVLSYASLGAAAIFSALKHNPLLILGEGLTMFTVPVPPALRGKTVAASNIGAKTGMIVIATKRNGQIRTEVTPDKVLHSTEDLVMLGDAEQRHLFAEAFG